MRLMSLALLSTAALSLALSACVGYPYNGSTVKDKIAADGEYWQRTSASSAIWTQGPKAQQTLNRDLSRCVSELQEQVRLGQIKSVFPPERTASTESDAQKRLNDWDSPERDGAMLAEDKGYNDFESCMKTKGWERVMNVRVDTGARAATNFMSNHVDYKDWDKKTYTDVPKTQAETSYDKMND